MLNDLARAQLAGFLATIAADQDKTISLGTLKHFIGNEGVAEIKSTKEAVAKAKKQGGALSLSEGAKEYWRRFKLLRARADRAADAGTQAHETKYSALSEKLRDDFFSLVPESEWRKFRIHDGPDDEKNWDWRWEGFEHRPPLLLMNLEGSFPIDKPMNYAQQEVIARFLDPHDGVEPLDEAKKAHCARLRQLANPDATTVMQMPVKGR